MTVVSWRVGSSLALLLLAFGALAQEGSGLAPSIPPAMGEQCVEPTDVMRRDHMRFLMHQRDATVHLGVRGTRHSLVGCIDCHAQRDERGVAIPVNAPGQFCESCHSFTGVSVDCFECHATVPAGARARAGLPAWMSRSAPSLAGVEPRERE